MKTVDKSDMPVAAETEPYVLIETAAYRTAVNVIREKVQAGEITLEEARQRSREATQLITTSCVGYEVET